MPRTTKLMKRAASRVAGNIIGTCSPDCIVFEYKSTCLGLIEAFS